MSAGASKAGGRRGSRGVWGVLTGVVCAGGGGGNAGMTGFTAVPTGPRWMVLRGLPLGSHGRCVPGGRGWQDG